MNIKQKFNNIKDCIDNSVIYNAYYNENIDENLIYFESRNGYDFTGNILRIIEELSKNNYGNFKIYLYAKPSVKNKIIQLKKVYNLKIDKIITNEAQATKILEKAKYIFTDSGIRPKYIKKNNQIFINTWHGTPLKLMGKDNPSEIVSIGHIQHSLLSSDYLLYPNHYMCEKMTNAYMIGKCYPGKVLFEGYPRNSVFFDDKRRFDLKNKLNYSDKEIFVYMPTFRGMINERDDIKQKNDIEEYLSKLDSNLNDNQILFVKLHVYNESKIDFSKFKHIKTFPDNYETYDFLNIADVLITDYSSVFFDFAVTKRKIIIFNYDEEEYLSYRGLYFPLSDLPFHKVSNVDDLIKELKLPKNYDDTDFLNKFCQYENINASRNICEHIFNGEKKCVEEVIKNNNENILIFAGSLMNNGITSSLINMLNNVDKKKYNFYITFKQWDEYILNNHETIFKKFPDDIEFLPIRFNFTPTVREKRDFNKYFTDQINFTGALHNLFKRSFDKQYKNLNFKAIIDFDGYNHGESLIFSNSDVNNTVWVHNDMIQESKTRNKQNLKILKDIYSMSNHVAVVSPNLVDMVYKITSKKDNVSVVHNINDYESIIEKSKSEIKLNESTIIYGCDICDVFKKSGKKFITIGRFSPEKGHFRLLKAFDEFCNDYPDSQLIIIGGGGISFDETVQLCDSLKYKENIILINQISNPMPILKKCDLFILSSFYEGWPMVIMEADTLNVPIIATDIPACQWMREYNGFLVENSQDGILNALYYSMENEIDTLTIDYQSYNQKAIDEFYSLFD